LLPRIAAEQFAGHGRVSRRNSLKEETMSETTSPPPGPDFSRGIDLAELPEESMLLGRVDGEPALLVRHKGECFAIGATCTHYGGPLADGIGADGAVRCPWHHACFSLRTGEAVRPPGLAPVACWRVERQGKTIIARERLQPAAARRRSPAGDPGSVVIIGGGAAAQVAAETLRREGYAGGVTMFSADREAPCDRPNLSKDYLAGTAPEDWIPLRPTEFYRENGIELRLSAPVAAIDPDRHEVRCADGSRCDFGALLLATGAEPVHLSLPGSDKARVFYLRSLADSRKLIAAAAGARRAVVVGASFIGLEVAASLRKRDLEVHVVAPEACPMERTFGTEIGGFVRRLHERNGVVFHLGTTVASIEEGDVVLANGQRAAADLVVLGVGVRPAVALAQQAGLAIDRGVVVDEYLETSRPGIFAAGDVARWPDRLTGRPIRVEHWVVAERQGQTAARNILGQKQRFDAVPFFWSQHYDTPISYVGHAEQWDRIEIDGSIEAGDCAVAYHLEGRKLAVATIGRDRESLEAERAFEQRITDRG
jgi:NADPH-dependent 2,4-dienoyl-CoA reductase/sulfur reductase-like enzyme/nitrite reductase/ring-hydroxylating ferredoxin subunit